MPIISSTSKLVKTFDLTITDHCGHASIVHVHPNHNYDITYTKNGKIFAKTGKIVDVVQDYSCGRNSHIVFDWSGDMSSRREQISFSAVQTLRDLTPNNAYQIALEEGFEGTLDDWFESMKGKSDYDLAVENGFEGTVEEWLESLRGDSKLTDEQVAYIAKWVEQAKEAEGGEEGGDGNGEGESGPDHPVTVIPSPDTGTDGEGEGTDGGSNDGTDDREDGGDGSNGSDLDDTEKVPVPPVDGSGDGDEKTPDQSSGDGSSTEDGDGTPGSDGTDSSEGRNEGGTPDNV